jgi:hypothetical protein
MLAVPVMKHLVLILAALLPAPALAAPGGPLRVLLKGAWVCETGGDATTPPTSVPQDGFRVIADSSYRTADGQSGSYLLLGKALTMTGGPFKGRRYVLVGQGILYPLDAQGQRGAERCVRQSSVSGSSDDTGN